MTLAVSFSMTAMAQHYVKIEKQTTSTQGNKKYDRGFIFSEEVDSAKVCYIHIISDNGSQSNIDKGITSGAYFLIQTYDKDIKEVKFYDNKGDYLRSNCFKQAEVVIKVADNDYIKFDDATFLNAEKVTESLMNIRAEIKSNCSYDPLNEILDLTNCPYSYIINNKKYKQEKPFNVSPDTQIEFLTTDKNVPNIMFSATEFIVESDPVNGGIIRLIKENWIIVLCALLVIGILAFLAYKILNKKYSNKSERDSDFNEDNIVGVNLTANQNIVDSMERISPVVDEKLYQKIADVLTRIENTQNAVSKQTATLESIKLLVSNTENKKQLAQKIQELETEKKKTATANRQRDTALSENEQLKKDIAQLRVGSQIEGALQVTEYSTFVSFAKKVVSECAEAENLAIKYWSSLNSKDQQILIGFLSKFHMTKCCVDLAKWNGIIATLDLKGYIKNDEYITYLTPLSDKDRMIFLNKRFFEDILRPYVGAIILFLEQIRTANKIGVSAVCNENIAGVIDSICTKCHEQGVFVDYRKLYEKVTEYDSLEIDEDVPEIIKKVIAKIEAEDTLLYVDKYAVNFKSGEKTEKTRCYIKI